MKKLTKKDMWLFATGQLGWATLSGIIVNWLIYFYQPDQSVQGDQSLFIPQGVVIFGALTVIGLISGVGRLFDAFTDPWIATLSDRCKHRDGRRIPFMKFISIPFAIITVLVFLAPIEGVSQINSIWLFVTLILFYLCMTIYCTPYNALIPEIAKTQEERLSVSTAISLTFIVGTAIAYLAPMIWGMFEADMGRVNAMRMTFAMMAFFATLCMLVPVFFIKEKDYATSAPSESKMLASLVKTFSNKTFRIFIASDVAYWIGLTMFQTGLPFYITSLLKLEESMTTILFVGMTVLSLLFYVPVNAVAKRVGKKPLLIFAFAMFAIVYIYTGVCGDMLPFNSTLQGFILIAIAALPMAIFGILPQAMVADISQADSIITGENREGMFYAARTFAFKLGQSVSMILFTAIATLGAAGTGFGYRMTAFTATVFCIIGGLIIIIYNEKGIDQIIHHEGDDLTEVVNPTIKSIVKS
ncbi:MAG: MFS transporter [Turicibacter sp.]